MMIKRKFFIFNCLCFLFLIANLETYACTSAIISGKITPDGRPLMWKNRDTGNLLNCVRYMTGEKYNFIAITDYSQAPQSIWIGTNETGFSIMNTVSYNLIEKKEGGKSRNGILMKRALEICATVNDFKHFLDTLTRPLQVECNYGVIDAQGNGYYFEVDDTHYTEYNVNDPSAAPHGYLVRTNYSVSGIQNKGAGYVRYQQADNTIFNAYDTGVSLTPEWIFSNLSRSFANPRMGIDLESGLFNKPQTNGWFAEFDFIARKKSSCAVVIQGVKPDEDASFTTMWTVIGYPPVTPAIPVWVKGAEKKLPYLLFTRNGKKYNSPLCDDTSLLRDKVYSCKHGKNAETYFNWELLFNMKGTGYMQLNEEMEHELFRTLYSEIEKWRTSKTPSTEDIYRLYDKSDEFIARKFTEIFESKSL